MKIKWWGHSCFRITADDGSVLITDPYDNKAYDGAVGYAKINEKAAVVTVSHSHPDHSNSAGVGGGPKVLDKPGEYEVAGFKIKGVATFHDPSKGADRGANIVFVIKTKSMTIAHFGDLGHPLSKQDLEAIGPVDVALVPIGGYFTIDAAQATELVLTLKPKIVMPMHYKTPVLKFPIALVDDFLAWKSVVRKDTNEVSITSASLPPKMEVWLLEYS